MIAAIPGDTITVANGSYSWDLVSFVNTKGSANAAPIVLMAQTFKKVVFTTNTRFEFQITNMVMTGFVFTNGNPAGSAVIKMGKSTLQGSNYCRISHIIIDNYNADTTVASPKNSEWIGIYGVRNRIDHCTFINKYYGSPVLVIWYDNATFPQKSTSTYHLIDSNYFNHIAYQGSNGGEYIRLGASANCNTDGYNTVEYNLFENGVQQEPEVISNKSNCNTYRYNTFKNNAGGITLRRGRYCKVYSNFFIKDTAYNGDNLQYGIRIFEKGHQVYNNYFEGIDGNKGTNNTARCPITINNGEVPISDTLVSASQALHFPADSCIIAFNSIVNAAGGQGIALGFTAGNSYPYQPKGVVIANNLIKMAQGVAIYNASTNTGLTYTAEGNWYQAPNGLTAGSGVLIPSKGFTAKTLSFGVRNQGILTPPASIKDNAVNSSAYTSMLNGKDLTGQNRSLLYDIGAQETDPSGVGLSFPLDSNMVGAGKPAYLLPLTLISFAAYYASNAITFRWQTEAATAFTRFDVQESIDGVGYEVIQTIYGNGGKQYQCPGRSFSTGKRTYRLKITNADGIVQYSPIRLLSANEPIHIQVFPNPTKGIIHIDRGNETTPVLLQVFNTVGMATTSFTTTQPQIELDTRLFPNGLYQLVLSKAGQPLYQFPFVVSH